MIRGFKITVSWWKVITTRPRIYRYKDPYGEVHGIQGTIAGRGWGIWVEPHKPIRYGGAS